MQCRGVDDIKGFIKTAGERGVEREGGERDTHTQRETDGQMDKPVETHRDMMMMTMMMKMKSGRMEMAEDGERKKEGGQEEEETRLK